jgi:autotransporter-associated beta strand protein
MIARACPFRRAFSVGLIAAAASAFAQIPSFPGAEGYGSHATGGRGGDVYIVTNLNASGAGSFADGVYTAPVAGRTIVFAVSGHIRLPSGSGGGLSISKNRITVAGQTAPGDGVCFWNNTMNLTGDDLVIRHVRWRYGKSVAGGEAVDIAGSQRIILDHCDVMFGTDENLSSFGTPPEFFTFQWSINAWGLQSHSAGGLWDIDHATAHHTLWANNHTRNPKCIGPSVFDWVNNVVFGWDIGFNLAPNQTGGNGFTNRVNIRGSTFSHGASASSVVYGGGANDDGSNKFKLHIADSALDGNNNGVLDVSKTNYAMVSSDVLYDQAATAWPQTVDGVTGGTAIGTLVTVDARLTAYKKVLSKVGAARMEYDAARPLRDELTQLAVTRTAAMQRGIISDPLELGLSTGTAFAALNSATALTDTDKDGMPDIWENALGMNAAVQSHNTVFPSSGGFITGTTFFPASTPAGYTHLEEYLHFKAQPHAQLPKNTLAVPTFIDVDLTRYTSGFTSSPVFTLSNVTGGSATQSGTGGKIVQFTPTQDAFGRAWFDFTVTDSAGSAWTQRFSVLVSASAIPRDLVWVGNGTTNPWDTTTAVWSRSGAATTFNEGDFVSLVDTGSAMPALALSGTLQPAAVLVDASAKNYTLTGGNFAGGMALTKRGSGTLTLRSNHAHTGGTTIEDGALVLGLVGTTPNSTGSVGSSTLTLMGDSTLTNAWYGTQLPLAAPIVVPAGGEPVIYTGRNIRFNGALTGDGTLTLVNQTVTGNTFELNGPLAAFAGTLRIIGGGGTNTSVRAIFNGGSFNGPAASTLDLGAGLTINPITNSGGNTFSIGSLTSTATDAILNGGSSGSPTYTVGALNASTTFAGKFQGNAKLTKVGTGTLTLTGASTHSGATAVNEGALVVDGSFGASAVMVASGATLAGGGTLGGTVTVSSGGSVQPFGTLTTGALTLTAPSLSYEMAAAASDRISVNGNATLSGAHTIQFTLADGSLPAGTYPLITTTGTLSAGGATFSHNLTNTPRQTFAIQTTANAVNLVVTGSPVTLAWSGAETQWDVAATSAWLNGAAPDVFHDADAVTFTDSATNGSVTLAENVAPRSVLVNNTAARPFALGGAAIAGSGALQKAGTGTLTLNAANTFTGGTVLGAGNLQLGNATANASALGTGAVTMDGGVLKMYSAGNATHAGTLPNTLNVVGSARLEVAPRCGFGGDVSGPGTLDYRTSYVRADVTGNWSAFTGQLNVTTTGSGDFRIASNYTWPGLPNASVNLAAGTYFYMSGIVSSGAGTTISIGALSGASGSHLRGGPTGDRTLTCRIGAKNVDATFAGTVGEQGATSITALRKAGTAVWTLSGACSHRGATVVESGTLRLASTASLTQTSDLTVQSGAIFDLQGASVTAGGVTFAEGSTLTYSGGTLTGEATLGGALSVNLTGIAGGQTLTLIQNTAAGPIGGTFAGKPEGTCLTSGGQTFRLSYLGGDGNDVTLAALTGAEAWRLTHFGTTANAGTAADTFDANGDGEVNFYEYATGQNPNAATQAATALLKNGATLEFTYTRANAALADGVIFTVEWSDTLAPGSWSSAGVSEQILTDNGMVQIVRASVAAGSGRRFLRLKVSKP